MSRWNTSLIVSGLLALLLGGAANADEVALVTHENLDYIPGSDYPDAKDQLDVFMPVGAVDVPVVVFFHGGGLLEGEKGHATFAAGRFVREGWGFVAPNYRLSPGVMHPSHVQDAAAAFAWVVKNIATFGGDPSRVFVAGHSAGGYLAVLLSLDPAHLAKHGLDLSAIRGTIGVSPFLYVEETARERPKTVWGTDPEAWLAASVAPHIDGGKPPMLLLYADGDEDWRKRHNETLAAALRGTGHSAVAVVEVANRNHGSLWTAVVGSDDPAWAHLVEFVRTQAAP